MDVGEATKVGEILVLKVGKRYFVLELRLVVSVGVAIENPNYAHVLELLASVTTAEKTKPTNYLVLETVLFINPSISKEFLNGFNRPNFIKQIPINY